MNGAWPDLGSAWRLARRNPGFTVVAVLTPALGIGANSAIFGLVDAVLLQTLPVTRPEQLVLIEQVMLRGGIQNISQPLFEQLREEKQVFVGVLAAGDGVRPLRVGDWAADPVGQRFGWGNPPDVQYDIEVVGVVEDAVYEGVREPGQPPIYFPSEAGRLYVVRAASAPESLVRGLRSEILAVDPRPIVTVVAPVRQEVERGLAREKLLARLTGFFGALAAGLAAIGLYGLMAYAVAGRTRDIGIRMALGAPSGHVLRAEVASALRLVAIGIAIGIPAAIAGGRLIAAQLFGVSASDPATLAAAAVLLALAGVLAAHAPARRASRVDPTQALRNQ